MGESKESRQTEKTATVRTHLGEVHLRSTGTEEGSSRSEYSENNGRKGRVSLKEKELKRLFSGSNIENPNRNSTRMVTWSGPPDSNSLVRPTGPDQYIGGDSTLRHPGTD